MKITKSRLIQLTVSLALTGILVYALVAEQENHKLAEIFRSIEIRGVICYFFLGIIGIIFRALRYQLLLRNILGAEKTPSYGQLFLITIVRNALVDFIPARAGELAYIYLLHRAGVPAATGASSFGFAFVLDIIVLLMISILFFCLSPLLFPAGLAGVTITPMTALLVVAILTLVLLILRMAVRNLSPLLLAIVRVMKRLFDTSRQQSSISRFVIWLETNIEQIAFDIDRLAKHGDLTWLVFYTFVLRFCKYLSLYVLLLAVVAQFGLTHREIHAGLSLLAFVAAEASASLPISGLMGFGAYESAWSLVFSLSHVTIPATFSISFVVHLITQVKGYSLGLLAMLVLLLSDVRHLEDEERKD